MDILLLSHRLHVPQLGLAHLLAYCHTSDERVDDDDDGPTSSSDVVSVVVEQFTICSDASELIFLLSQFPREFFVIFLALLLIKI